MISAMGLPRRAFLLVMAALLGALLWKVMFFVVISRVYFDFPVAQRLFPAFFESPVTFATSYAGVLILLVCLLLVRRKRTRQRLVWMALGCTSILCLHQGSYNDATFTTAWWALVWCAWFSGRIDDPVLFLMPRAARLSRAIVAMILLGGAVGKWTPEYWSGQVLYEIYFVDRDFWAFNILRTSYDADTLRAIATWYSRLVIVIESVCGLTLWALPSRVAAVVGVAVCGAMVLSSNLYLVSVLLSLMGLAAVGLLPVAEPLVRGSGVAPGSGGRS